MLKACLNASPWRAGPGKGNECAVARRLGDDRFSDRVSDAARVAAKGELSGAVAWREENPVFARCGSLECTDECTRGELRPNRPRKASPTTETRSL